MSVGYDICVDIRDDIKRRVLNIQILNFLRKSSFSKENSQLFDGEFLRACRQRLDDLLEQDILDFFEYLSNLCTNE